MILATVGTLSYPRLVEAMDQYAGQCDEQVIIQMAETPYVCQHAQAVRYLEHIDQVIDSARVVVGHCGTGTMRRLVDQRKAFVLVPRRAHLQEHHDDHQWELAMHLADRLPGVVVDDISELPDAIAAAPERAASVEFHSTRPRLLSALRATVEALCGYRPADQ